jgi:hypothetical protein
VQRAEAARAPNFKQSSGSFLKKRMNALTALEYFRDARIMHDPALLQEARELASIFAKALQTARANTARMKNIT